MNALSDFIDKEQFSKQIPISDQISLKHSWGKQIVEEFFTVFQLKLCVIYLTEDSSNCLSKLIKMPLRCVLVFFMIE